MQFFPGIFASSLRARASAAKIKNDFSIGETTTMPAKGKTALSRRKFLKTTAATVGMGAIGAAVPLRYALGNTPFKIGLVLPKFQRFRLRAK
jgi:hypothetical protein